MKKKPKLYNHNFCLDSCWFSFSLSLSFLCLLLQNWRHISLRLIYQLAELFEPASRVCLHFNIVPNELNWIVLNVCMSACYFGVQFANRTAFQIEKNYSIVSFRFWFFFCLKSFKMCAHTQETRWRRSREQACVQPLGNLCTLSVLLT